jgi:hypothetical protein
MDPVFTISHHPPPKHRHPAPWRPDRRRGGRVRRRPPPPPRPPPTGSSITRTRPRRWALATGAATTRATPGPRRACRRPPPTRAPCGTGRRWRRRRGRACIRRARRPPAPQPRTLSSARRRRWRVLGRAMASRGSSLASACRGTATGSGCAHTCIVWCGGVFGALAISNHGPAGTYMTTQPTGVLLLQPGRLHQCALRLLPRQGALGLGIFPSSCASEFIGISFTNQSINQTYHHNRSTPP